MSDGDEIDRGLDPLDPRDGVLRAVPALGPLAQLLLSGLLLGIGVLAARRSMA